jgi:hypothetical protein
MVKVSGCRPSQVVRLGAGRRTETAHVRTRGQRARCLWGFEQSGAAAQAARRSTPGPHGIAVIEQLRRIAFGHDPTGVAVAWNNPQSGKSGAFTPLQTTKDPATRHYCRRFSAAVSGAQQAGEHRGRLSDGGG